MRSPDRLRAAVPLALALILTGCEGEDPSTPAAVSADVYFLRGERLVRVERKVPAPGVARGALEALLSGPATSERSSGITTEIPSGVRLLGVSIEDGVARVDLSKGFETGGGSLSMRGRIAQVVFTLTALEPVERVSFLIDGEPVEAFGGEGVLVDDPVGRERFADFLPVS